MDRIKTKEEEDEEEEGKSCKKRQKSEIEEAWGGWSLNSNLPAKGGGVTDYALNRRLTSGVALCPASPPGGDLLSVFFFFPITNRFFFFFATKVSSSDRKLK